SRNKYDGISLFCSSNNIISGNIASDNRVDGIFLYTNCHDNIITSNNASRNGRDGLYLIGSVNNFIKSNVFMDNWFAGIYLWQSSSNTTIIENNITNNDCTGVYLDDSNDNIIKDNYIAGNEDEGIAVYDSWYNNITRNVLEGNGRYGVVMWDLSSCNRINENSFLSGTPADFCGGNNWDGNYWHDYVERYPNATNDGTAWDTPYEVETGSGLVDHYPIVNSYHEQISSNGEEEDENDDTILGNQPGNDLQVYIKPIITVALYILVVTIATIAYTRRNQSPTRTTGISPRLRGIDESDFVMQNHENIDPFVGWEGSSEPRFEYKKKEEIIAEYKSRREHARKNGEKSCIICHEYLHPEDTHALSCPHCEREGHHECLESWLENHSICPVCLKSLVKPEIVPEILPEVTIGRPRLPSGHWDVLAPRL
ncbi:MAG: NosD domain-containing protein, partial [Candidatus Hodarchaeota archaeon]